MEEHKRQLFCAVVDSVVPVGDGQGKLGLMNKKSSDILSSVHPVAHRLSSSSSAIAVCRLLLATPAFKRERT
jgi:hypothetical protein